MFFLQDGGSLDLVLNAGRIPVDIIGKITVAVGVFICTLLLSLQLLLLPH